jgi:hypothetical protein
LFRRIILPSSSGSVNKKISCKYLTTMSRHFLPTYQDLSLIKSLHFFHYEIFVFVCHFTFISDPKFWLLVFEILRSPICFIRIQTCVYIYVYIYTVYDILWMFYEPEHECLFKRDQHDGCFYSAYENMYHLLRTASCMN